ncbi:hypothetical protein HD597_007001 [Nonomuraea thailandensis]|uniref:YncE family protein n=1 Tax=Nonomuraea thailandensis TaxID=1188745 RepID=A0A9X2K7P1_9ACTN|nr:hypothetical protein [Nonomuraea thailandensis]MCP2359981.1 hypothetical protein [Nonomuraea thailandensis]
MVTKSDGTLIDTIGGLSSAVALSVADNGRHVYAALRDSHEVIEIDITTLAITRRIDLSAYPCPSTLAQAYERVWVGYGCGQAGEGGVVALETWRPTPVLVPVESGTTQPPLVAVAGRTLAVGEPGADPASIRVCRSNIELRGLSCGYAAWRYSLITPVTTGFRWIDRRSSRSVTSQAGCVAMSGGRCCRD